MKADEREWLYEMFLPALVWRARKRGEVLFKDEAYEQTVRRLLVKSMPKYEWSTGSNFAALSCHRFAMCFSFSFNIDDLSSWHMFSISSYDSIAVKNLTFMLNARSSKHDAFAYSFSKLSSDVCRACDLDFPDGAIWQLRECIESREANELLYLPYIEVLKPQETLEEVLIERDLASV